MKKIIIPILLFLVLSCTGTLDYAVYDVSYQVGFENPQSHYMQVKMRCTDLDGSSTLFKLPMWTPGYYMILSSPMHIHDFVAKDLSGNILPWRKEKRNGWRVENGRNSVIEITYSVYAADRSVAESEVDSLKAFISPTTVFMYPDGHLKDPVTITVDKWDGWSAITTGLERISEKGNVFCASDFDRLYDSPIYVGNQEVYTFSLDDREYELSIENPDGFDSDDYIACLKKIIGVTTGMMQDVPYKHYSFIIMGPGGGGLEHLNSQAVFTGRGEGENMHFANDRQRNNFLEFMTHEYFHLYNVKTIRPIELGPFDYDRECYTNQLWISEGITTYYEYLLMERAGFISRGEVLNKLRRDREGYEPYKGKERMSLARSSYDIWLNFFNWGEHGDETTISYYQKGPLIAYLMDMKIQENTAGNRSLDDLMRLLYNKYYKSLNRGFTEDEFWNDAESVAGCPLDTIKQYVYTTCPVDYKGL